ncbi:MAG TPA: diiron oxygenase [Acidimicrobiales bacterium]|jgi:ribosomal protein S18 acetylase RimI-like enzyme
MTTESYLRLTERLSEASLKRHWEAYRDIDWDAPENRIEAGDPRWEASGAWEPLATTEWYRDQAPELRASIALRRHLAAMRVGIEFERVLGHGLLEFASRLPNRHPAFRYVYHEITEEAQHTMMFQEFVNRSGFDPAPAPEHVQMVFDRAAGITDDHPVLFFLAVLCGEEVFDYVNRQALAAPSPHPLLAQVCRIHITEEARHISFARAYMREAVAGMDARDIRCLRYAVAFVLDWTSTYMFAPAASFLDELGVPADVVAAMNAGAQTRTVRRESVAGAAALCRSLGLVDPRMATVWSRVLGPAPA